MSVMPNFLYIGAAKAGSNWLYSNMREHPDIYLPLTKRTFFFDRNYHCGPEWYMEHFKPRSGERAVGEICHDYFLSEQVAVRIHETLPDAKLLCCLRNPAERLISAYLHEREHGHIGKMSFADFVKQDHVLKKSDYMDNLAPFFKLFPREQILVLFYDDLCSEPDAFFARVCDFLGVDRGFRPSALARRVNPTRKVRFPFLAKRLYKVARSDDASKHAATFRNRFRSRMMRWFESVLYTGERATMTPAHAEFDELKRAFRGSYPGLSELIGAPVPQAWYA